MKYLLCLIFACCTGCSMALDWNKDNLSCDANAACDSDYSCLPEGVAPRSQCVRDGSRQLHEVCALDRQCATGHVCGGTCEPACAPSNGFLQAEACGPGLVCRNISDTAAPSGACMPSDACMAGARCASSDTPHQGVCVPISATAQACLPGCQVSWASGAYADTCDADATCQPVGMPGELYLTCLPNSPGPAVPGAPCSNAVADPCASGLLCIDGACRLHCDPTGGVTVCDDTTQCRAVPLAAGNPYQRQIGYCAAN